MYYIENFYVCDTESDKCYYIREILDGVSAEFKRSTLTPGEKCSIVMQLGLQRLIRVLAECYSCSGHSYDASQEAEFTYNHMLKGRC